MAVHVYIIESEVPQSPTSVRPVWQTIRAALSASGRLGQSAFVDAATRVDLLSAAAAFGAWTRQVPVAEPIVLWLSLHGADPEPGVADDADRKKVGTAGVSSVGEEVEWVDFLSPAKAAASPGRVVVIADVCGGSSPAAPARLARPADQRPHMVFGPTRAAFAHELALASQTIIGWIANNGLPSGDQATSLVDSLNLRFPGALTGTDWYRAWWWAQGDETKMHPGVGERSRIKRT